MKISVITPLYNGRKYLNQLVHLIWQNVCAADGKIKVQYLLVNDKPEEQITQKEIDQIRESVIRAHGNQDLFNQFQVTLVVNDKNRGIHYSRANGLKYADGTFVMFLDQDDKLDVQALLKLSDAARKQGNIDVFAANGYRKYHDHMDKIYKRDFILSHLGNESLYLRGTDLIFSPGQCLIRRKSIPVNWENHILSVNGCDDMYLWLLMLNQGKRFLGIRECLYYHMETDENYSNSFEKMQQSFESVCSVLEEIDGYSVCKINILRRRGKLKTVMKTERSMLTKIKYILLCPDIIFSTIFYKICGYH